MAGLRSAAIALAAGALIGAGATTALGADATVTKIYDIKSDSGQVRYAYGAAWIPGPSRMYRVTPSGRVTRGTNLPGAIVDFTEGFGRIWVLWEAGRNYYVAQLNRKNGRVIGSPRRWRTRSFRSDIEAGAGSIWVGGVSNTLFRLNRKTLRAQAKRLPGGGASQFWVEKGGVYTVVQRNLVRHQASNLRRTTRTTLPAGALLGSIAYGGGSFLLGWDRGFVGQVATLTPGAGVTASATLDPASSDVDAVTVGGGASWVAYDSGPSNGSVFTTYLARYGPGLGTVATAPLPGVQAVNGLAVGGGSVWVNDGIDGKLYQVDPASIT